MPNDLWQLPADVDGWLIGEESALAALPANTEGFALARLRDGSYHNSRFHHIRLPDRALMLLWQLLPIFAVSWILFTVMSFNSSGGNVRTTGTAVNAQSSVFGGKDYPDLADYRVRIARSRKSQRLDTPVHEPCAVLASFLAARWIIADQRNRCPVCLRLLAHPVRIGESSRILLEWHGTELMCDRGHGLLYVPEWPAIWSARQRWMQLGPTWSGLFR